MHGISGIITPQKLILAASFAIIFLFAFNMPTILDLANNLILYYPLYALISLPDLILYGEEENMHEIRFIHLKHKILDFFRHLANTILAFAVMIVVISIAYTLIFGESFRQGVKLDTVVINTLSSSMLIGIVVLLCAVILRNKSATYIIGFAFWIYWNVNSGSSSVLNPFTFIADPNEWASVVLPQTIFIIVAMFLIAFLNSKSPYLGQEVFNRIRMMMPRPGGRS